MPDDTAASRAALPRHLRTDLHVHSTHSDGHSTVEALVERARDRGLTLAMTDHLSIDQKINSAPRLASYLAALEPYAIYRGVEVDIGEEIAIPPDSRARLDLVIGSMHHVTREPGTRYSVPATPLSAAHLDDYMEHYVAALVRGLTSRLFTFIGHPTHLVDLPGEYQAQHGAQERHDALWTAPRRQAVIDAAVASGTAFEISSRYRVPSPTFMREALEAGMSFAVGSDSHWIDRIGDFSLPLRYIEEFTITPERFVLPARTLEGGDPAVV